ncbi:head GIN domain-containing protein [Pontimicrobium sp. SW4]|uniref:Head GIN domain-containing protein n=1 Tax=Pontimicrobium sp. SW4 TaxID=3153519 RepID=A0AAU7BWA0_9FLAO
MKTNILYIILIALCISSCNVDNIRVNDTITSREISYTNYDAIEIANGFKAYVTFSDTEESIKIEANDNLHEHIIVTNNDNTLKVKVKNNVNIKGSATINVYITTRIINSFKASSDAKIYLQNVLIANNAKIRLAADSYFSGEINVDNLEFSGSADTKADLYGFVDNLDLDLSADSKMYDYDLIVNNLKIDMSADCKAYLTVNETIDIDAVADCTLYYKGNADITHQNLRADSRIIKVD